MSRGRIPARTSGETRFTELREARYETRFTELRDARYETHFTELRDARYETHFTELRDARYETRFTELRDARYETRFTELRDARYETLPRVENRFTELLGARGEPGVACDAFDGSHRLGAAYCSIPPDDRTRRSAPFSSRRGNSDARAARRTSLFGSIEHWRDDAQCRLASQGIESS